jgi:hypothetical protein
VMPRTMMLSITPATRCAAISIGFQPRPGLLGSFGRVRVEAGQTLTIIGARRPPPKRSPNNA